MKVIFYTIFISLILLNFQCPDKCTNSYRRKYGAYFCAEVKDAPDTIKVGDRIRIRYELRKDSAGIGGLNHTIDLINATKLTTKFKCNKYINATNFDLYKPDIFFINGNLNQPNLLGNYTSTANFYNLNFKDDVNKFLLEFEIAFRDTGLYSFRDEGIDSYIRCDDKKSIGKYEYDFSTYYNINTLSTYGAFDTFTINNSIKQTKYTIYVKQ